tara:strand:- start:3083 stop:3526 length:444 start_codon:yes stop_codon:yes gene_type:complete
MLFKTKLVAFILLLIFPTICSAQNITFYKKGTKLKLRQDLHCMDNDTALFVIQKLEFCPTECEFKLQEAKKLAQIDIKLLKDKLVLQEKKYLSIVEEKDQTIRKIQTEAIDEMDKARNSLWWKITVSVLGGIALGASTTFLIMKYVK